MRMAKVRLVGPRRRLDLVLEELHRLELVQLADVRKEPYGVAALPEDERRRARADELRSLIAELEALLSLLGPGAPPGRADLIPGGVDAANIRARMEEVVPPVERLRERIGKLEDELVVLPR